MLVEKAHLDYVGGEGTLELCWWLKQNLKYVAGGESLGLGWW